MLKYTDVKIVMAEVPNEISLAINLSKCPNRCSGCHSPQLRGNIGRPLDWVTLKTLIYISAGISCVVFMGGDNDTRTLNKMAEKVKHLGLKTAWYSGKKDLPRTIKLKNFNYIKLGPYMEDAGPLNSPTTNQRFYKVVQSNVVDTSASKFEYSLEDITHTFWKT